MAERIMSDYMKIIKVHVSAYVNSNNNNNQNYYNNTNQNFGQANSAMQDFINDSSSFSDFGENFPSNLDDDFMQDVVNPFKED